MTGPDLLLVGVLVLAATVALTGALRAMLAACGLGVALLALGTVWGAVGPLVAP